MRNVPAVAFMMLAVALSAQIEALTKLGFLTNFLFGNAMAMLGLAIGEILFGRKP